MGSSFATHLALPLRIMLTASMPATSVMPSRRSRTPSPTRPAFSPCDGPAQSHCLRYLYRRRRTRRGRRPSAFKASTAAAYAGFLSTLITRGAGFPGVVNALWKRLAPVVSRLAVSRKIDGLARRIHGRIQIRVFAFDLVVLPASRPYGSSCWSASNGGGSACSTREHRPAPTARCNGVDPHATLG
jgi:hypothetical protein